ncbi:MAG: ATP synthase F0 subunit A [Nitrospirae bacterium RBG_19FT_COMBO_55_12]|nr:MAG: ATP synthase F0 subunit A [Nitrospirae bacterium RBG_19FT_COMBO_55_12]
MKESPLLIHIPNVPEQVTYTWVAMALLIGLALAVRMTLKKTAPGGVQNVMEVVISGLVNFIEEIMGPEGKRYFPLIASLFLFILVCNFLGLIPGFDSPTANLNTTLALALVAFTATHYIGIRRHGFGYIKHFFGPLWALAPFMFIIEGISHLARVLSLSFRLFGNMIAKHKLLIVLFFLFPYFLQVPILGLGVLVAFIQAGVFTLLTMLYLAGSIEEAHIGAKHH